MRGKFGTPLTTRAEVEKGDSIIELTTKKELKDAITEENIQRFSLIKGTPFTEGQLHEDIGDLANKLGAQLILDGNYQPPPDLENPTNRVIKLLRKPSNKWLDIEEKFTIQEHSYVWKKKKSKQDVKQRMGYTSATSKLQPKSQN